MLKFFISETDNQLLRRSDYTTVVSDAQSFVQCECTFPESWSAFEKTAIFKKDGASYPVIGIETDIPVNIPAMVLNGTGEIGISFIGVNGETLSTSSEVNVSIIRSGLGDNDFIPSESFNAYQQYVNLVISERILAQTAATNSESIKTQIETKVSEASASAASAKLAQDNAVISEDAAKAAETIATNKAEEALDNAVRSETGRTGSEQALAAAQSAATIATTKAAESLASKNAAEEAAATAAQQAASNATNLVNNAVALANAAAEACEGIVDGMNTMIDTTTAINYKVGIKSGIIYLEEV